MAGENVSFILSIGLLLVALLFIVRLWAIKTNHDPVMRKYKPGTPVYEAYRKLASPRKFTFLLTTSIIAAILLAAYAASTARNLLNTNTPASHYMLIFGPIAAIVIFAVALVSGYFMLVRK